MNLYVLIHNHKQGDTKYVFQSDIPTLQGFYWEDVEPDDNTWRLIRRFGIDFDPKEGESIDITWLVDTAHMDMVPFIPFGGWQHLAFHDPIEDK